MAVTTSTPSLTKVASEYNYLNSLSLQEGLHMPEVGKELVYRYGKQDVTGLIEKLGQMKSINNIEFTHYEQDRIHGTFRASASAAAITSSAKAASGQIVIASSYNYTYTGQSPYETTSTFTTYMPQVNDVIEFNGYQAIVTAVSGASATFVPVSSAIDRPALATDDDIIILSNAQPEGSGSPESRNSQLLSYTNYLQIFRRKHRVTGTENDMKTWIEVTGKDGQKGYFWYLEGIADEYTRFMNEREAALIAGVKLDNAANIATAGGSSYGDVSTTLTTEGLIPQISGNGNTETYTTFSLTDLENMTKNLQKYVGARKNLLAVGHNLRLEIDALLRDTNSAGALGTGSIIFNQFNGAGEQSVNFEFDKIKYGGFEFAVQTLDIFSDPTFLGYEGGIYKDIGMVIPMDTTVTYNRMNGSSSTVVPSLRVNYLGNRLYKEWVHGLGMGVATAGNDYYDVEFMSHCGLEAFALNRFGLFLK